MVVFQQYEAAVELLDKALGKAPDSLNHQIDALRVARARAQAELGVRMRQLTHCEIAFSSRIHLHIF